MTRHRRPRVLTALLLAGACAACTPSAGPAASPTTASAEVSDVVAMSPLSGRSGPLVEVMDLARDLSSPTYLQDLVADFREREDRVAACMAEQGFEYEPVTLEEEDVTLLGQDVPTPGTREFVERHGYGIADDTMPPGSYTWEMQPPRWESMSGAAKEAYMVALDGMTVDGTPVGDELDADGVPRPSGCNQRAMLGAVDDASADLIQEALDHLEAMPDDGRFDELDGEWSRCMDGQGYEHASPTAARTALEEAWAELLGTDGTASDADRAGARELEVAVAAADLACQLETDYLGRWTELAAAYQEEFIDTHQGEIDAWLEARG